MPLQSRVALYPAPAVPGDRASHNVVVHAPGNPRAEGDVAVGGFVWPGSDPAAQVKASGTGKPLGLVERRLTHGDAGLTSEGSLTLPDGTSLTVALSGDYYAAPLTAAVVGQKVFAVLADGSVKTGAAGASVAGAVETDWTVMTSGAAGECVVVSAR